MRTNEKCFIEFREKLFGAFYDGMCCHTFMEPAFTMFSTSTATADLNDPDSLALRCPICKRLAFFDRVRG